MRMAQESWCERLEGGGLAFLLLVFSILVGPGLLYCGVPAAGLGPSWAPLGNWTICLGSVHQVLLYEHLREYFTRLLVCIKSHVCKYGT